jgi:hypothetical protein
MKQAHLLNTISGMISRYVPGSTEEKQLVHLIDANLYMMRHNCSLTEALQATAKKNDSMASEGDVRLDHLKKAYEYREKFECTLTDALSKTAPAKEADSGSVVIAEQIDHVWRARKYQNETDCPFEEALSITAPKKRR